MLDGRQLIRPRSKRRPDRGATLLKHATTVFRSDVAHSTTFRQQSFVLQCGHHGRGNEQLVDETFQIESPFVAYQCDLMETAVDLFQSRCLNSRVSRRDHHSPPSPDLFIKVWIENRIDLAVVRVDECFQCLCLLIVARHLCFDLHLCFTDPSIGHFDKLQIHQMILEPRGDRCSQRTSCLRV